MSEAVDVIARLSETFDPGGACDWEGEDGEWLAAHSEAIDAVGRVYEALREENARLRDALDAIASPGTNEDFGNGWAVGLARRALLNELAGLPSDAEASAQKGDQ